MSKRAWVRLPDVDLATLYDVLKAREVREPYEVIAAWTGATQSAVQKRVLRQRRERDQ